MTVYFLHADHVQEGSDHAMNLDLWSEGLD